MSTPSPKTEVWTLDWSLTTATTTTTTTTFLGCDSIEINVVNYEDDIKLKNNIKYVDNLKYEGNIKYEDKLKQTKSEQI